MSINEIQSVTKAPFFCETCDYKTTIKFNMNKHLASIKHSNKINDVIKIHQCEQCMKVFNSRQSLHSHNKKPCSVKQQSIQPQTEKALLSMMEIIQNQNKIIEKTNEMMQKQTEQLTELKTTMASTPAQIVNNIVYDSSHKVVNNVQFNIKTYLKDTCSDAYNFEESLPKEIDIETILAFDEKKLTNRNLFTALVNGFWKGLPQIMRPIQATDLRRNTFFMKIGDEWLKSTTDIEMIKCQMNALKNPCFRPLLQLIKNDKGSNVETESTPKHLLALNAVNHFDDIFVDCLPQILPKTAIDRKLIGDGDNVYLSI